MHRLSLLKSFALASALIVLAPFVTVAETPMSDHGLEKTWTQGSYEPYPLPYFVDDLDRYATTTPPANTVNRNGELEYIGSGVFAAHWFVESNDAVWHFVTAGDASNDVVVMVHGHPDTWYAYSKVMSKLADDYYVIAVDTLG